MTKTPVTTSAPKWLPDLGLATFDFHGRPAAIYTDARGHWVFPGQLCSFMGIDSEAQRKNITQKHWSAGWTSVTEVRLPEDDRSRGHFLLHQRRLPMWLGSITTSRLRDAEIRARVEEHQTEFADALADYLTKGVAINPHASQNAEVVISGDDLDVIEGMVRAIRADRRRLAAVEETQAALVAKVDAIEGRHGWFTALAHAKLHDHNTERSYLSRVGIRASAICRERGIKPHPREDATFGQINTYPVDVLNQAFAEVSA